MRRISTPAPLLTEPDEGSIPAGALKVGDKFRMLDISRGWAWGYGPAGRVGYVRSEALVP